jgi:hypothetical protein
MGVGTAVAVGKLVGEGTTVAVGRAGAEVGAEGAQAESRKKIVIASRFIGVSETSIWIARIYYHSDSLSLATSEGGDDKIWPNIAVRTGHPR